MVNSVELHMSLYAVRPSRLTTGSANVMSAANGVNVNPSAYEFSRSQGLTKFTFIQLNFYRFFFS